LIDGGTVRMHASSARARIEIILTGRRFRQRNVSEWLCEYLVPMVKYVQRQKSWPG